MSRTKTEFARDLGRLVRVGRESASMVDELDEWRPQVRGDCAEGERPCPWVGCRYHLGVEALPSGSIRLRQSDPVQGETCALDLAERGGMTLAEVGDALGVTRERVRQIEERAIARIRKSGKMEVCR